MPVLHHYLLFEKGERTKNKGLLVRTHIIARTGKIDLPHIRRKLDKEDLDSGAGCAPKVSHTDCVSIESYL